MATNIQSTDLDFDAIKENLKTYFQAQDEFSDYNFEGAALSNILDVLAWNTHFNALTANMAINESFLQTAQLRSAVVTHAQSLGYFPKSKTSARATVRISVDLSGYVGTRPDTLTLPSGTKFTSTVDGSSYVFQTRTAYSATDDGFGVFNFVDENGSTSLKIYEGKEITKTFLVPARSTQPVYVIPDDSMDTETAVVRVFANQNTTNFEPYSDIRHAIRITASSAYYILREAPNQHYELQFGPDNTFGKSPSAGNKIEVNYLRVNGEDANGARIFVPQESFVVDGQEFSLNVIREEVASSGSDRESVEKMRANAPLNYASQRRMVTTSDYEALITSEFSTVSSVSAWGGEENDPVDYGKVYLSILYEDENVDSDSKTVIQEDIRENLIEPLATMSIDPVFIEPTIVSIAITCRYDFNPNKSELTAQATNTVIRNEIKSYFNENLKSFGGNFRKSELTARIDDLNDAILSTQVDIRLVQGFEPLVGTSKSYNIIFPSQIANPDKDEITLNSSIFVYDGQNARFKNKLGTNVIQVVAEGTNAVLNSNVGTYSDSRGTVNIDAVEIDSLLSGDSEIKLIVTPNNQSTVKPIRNYILDLENDLTNIIPTIDYQTTRTAL